MNEWCKLFIATPSYPEPWTKRVPESLIVGSIEKALPLTPEWDTFRMSVTAKDESLISYMGLVQGKCNRILRARQGTTPNAAMQSGDQGKQLTPVLTFCPTGTWAVTWPLETTRGSPGNLRPVLEALIRVGLIGAMSHGGHYRGPNQAAK